MVDDVRKATEDELSFANAFQEVPSCAAIPAELMADKMYYLGFAVQIYHWPRQRHHPQTLSCICCTQIPHVEPWTMFSRYKRWDQGFICRPCPCYRWYAFDCRLLSLYWRYAEWAAVPALDTMKHIVFRVSNRLFVGSPLCMFGNSKFPSWAMLTMRCSGRDPNFRAINDQYATSLYKTILIRNVPAILQPCVFSIIYVLCLIIFD